MVVDTKVAIVSDPEIMMGKPTVAGTRITVEYLLRLMAAGHSISAIVEEHPHLSPQAVQKACLYAAEFLREEWLKTRNDNTQPWLEDA